MRLGSGPCRNLFGCLLSLCLQVDGLYGGCVCLGGLFAWSPSWLAFGVLLLAKAASWFRDGVAPLASAPTDSDLGGF